MLDCKTYNGSISAERHWSEKTGYAAKVKDPVALEIMGVIKHALDPKFNNRESHGKMV